LRAKTDFSIERAPILSRAICCENPAMNVAARSISSLDLQRADESAARAPARADAASRVELQLITERRDFDALEDDWNDLFQRAGKPTHVFQSFNLCWHWANHHLASENGASALKLSIVTGRRNGRLIMVWPLASERVRGITQTFWMGEPVAQYGDALIDAESDALAVLRAGLDFLRSQTSTDLLRLRRVREDANVAPLMTEAGAYVADRQTAPYMDLASAKDFARFEERYSSKMRRNRRRLARRLEEKGSVEFVRLHGGAEAGKLAARAIAVKSEWLKDRGLVSHAFADEKTARLFADLAEGKTKPVPCVVSALKANGETAALEVSFTCKGRLVIHVMAFDLEYEKSGVGVLLLEENLKQGYAEGLNTYDMMAPGDPYKLDWCDKSDGVCDWVKPLSVKGYLYARIYLGFLRSRLKSALKAMPQPMRRLMRKGYDASATEN
jgi:CelD/BcsL family acetyltransferase involved in cellulose biosynthesis